MLPAGAARLATTDAVVHLMHCEAGKDAKEAARETKPVSQDPADWKLKLVVSDDGVKYRLVTHLGVPGHPNETTLRFLAGGELMAMVRREGGNTMGWLGSSKPPYKEWKWVETKHRFGGPNFDTLYATCGDRVYKRKLKVTGANAWDTPVKPTAPRL